MQIHTDWASLLNAEFEQPYWSKLQAFVESEREQHTVYPPANEVFRAFDLCPYETTKVVILGQDPYHGPGQANGLAFSVAASEPIAPSLLNIHKELASDLGIERPGHGLLEPWATQGVLLLNATLTVRARTAASHQKQGWETFTDQVIRAVNAKADTVVFVLWGASARKKVGLIDLERHVVIESPHPSPLSSHRGFFGSKPFSRTNEALIGAGRSPIDWTL